MARCCCCRIFFSSQFPPVSFSCRVLPHSRASPPYQFTRERVFSLSLLLLLLLPFLKLPVFRGELKEEKEKEQKKTKKTVRHGQAQQQQDEGRAAPGDPGPGQRHAADGESLQLERFRGVDWRGKAQQGGRAGVGNAEGRVFRTVQCFCCFFSPSSSLLLLFGTCRGATSRRLALSLLLPPGEHGKLSERRAKCAN